MNLVKIGPLTINLDRVACVRELTGRTATPGAATEAIRIEFTDGQHLDVHHGVQALRAWIASHAEVLEP